MSAPMLPIVALCEIKSLEEARALPRYDSKRDVRIYTTYTHEAQACFFDTDGIAMQPIATLGGWRKKPI